jgi:hypothetical protein
MHIDVRDQAAPILGRRPHSSVVPSSSSDDRASFTPVLEISCVRGKWMRGTVPRETVTESLALAYVPCHSQRVPAPIRRRRTPPLRSKTPESQRQRGEGRSWVRALRGALVMAVVLPFAFASLGDLDETSFVCEEALAHAESCCGRLSLQTDFCATVTSCDGSPQGSRLSVAQSRCILATDCGAMERICAALPTWGDAEAGAEMTSCR